ncbi:MAG: hypothetical protein EXR31_08600 [Betaproteobacteria bacterium]|nr:hypothetical protein [Betaproteobacteria bacterium]
MCLVARHIEANGIPTMCLGSALDIIECGRPPRATFVDYPLGHSAGKPLDTGDQLEVVRAALRGLEDMQQPGEIRILPNRWDANDAWRQDAARDKGGDTRQPRDETPQFQHAADREAARASGALPT